MVSNIRKNGRHQKQPTSKKGIWSAESFLLLLLIASLPLFSLRSLTFGYSITLLILIIILARESIRLIFLDVRHLTFNTIDTYILAYLALASLTIIYAQNENYQTALIKSYFYFISYISLKIYFSSVPVALLVMNVIRGIKFGLFLFCSAAVFAVVSTGQAGGIFSDLSYWGFTFKIFSAMNEVLGTNSDGITAFESRLVMKNSIGEAFALFTILLYLFYIQGSKKLLPYVFLSAILVFLTFSRRSILEITVAYLFITTISITTSARSSIVAAKLVISICIIVAVIAVVPSYDGRFDQIGQERRFDDLMVVVEQTLENWVSGYGYAEKVNGEKYVHNFILAGFFMMGILGLLTSCLVYFELLKSFVRRAIASPDINAALLSIPLISCMVSSTVEGIFTPPSWIALALYLSMEKSLDKQLTSRKRKNFNGKKKDVKAGRTS